MRTLLFLTMVAWLDTLKRGPVEPVQSCGISGPGLAKGLPVAVLLSHGRPGQQFPEAGQSPLHASPEIFDECSHFRSLDPRPNRAQAKRSCMSHHELSLEGYAP
jgi:hypothetical protein